MLGLGRSKFLGEVDDEVYEDSTKKKHYANETYRKIVPCRV
jgi:hypothetical protein